MAPEFPVLYTKFAHREVMRFDPTGERGYRQRLRVIPHGVDCATFRALPAAEVAAFREFYFQGKVKPGTFLVVNVNRNQPRKDLVRQLLFVREHPEEAGRIAADAQEWVQGLRWERVLNEYWLPLFARAARLQEKTPAAG